MNSDRYEFEQKIISFMQDLENDKNGFNSNYYKEFFASMSDKQFDEFVNKLATNEKFNLFFEADILDKKHSPDLHRLKALGNKYNVPLTEYITLPYKDNSDPAHPYVTAQKVPVVLVTIRPLQQMIDKKNARSSDTSSTNSLTGQVSGKSKVVTFTNMETASLQASNQSKVVRELLGPRSDDYKAKAKMIAQIENTGDYDLDDIEMRPEDKRSLGTAKIMLMGAGLDIALGNQKTFKETHAILEKAGV